MSASTQPAARDGTVLAKAAFRAADLLGLADAELARVLGVHPSTVSRARQRGTLTPDSNEGERALLFLRIFRSLDAIVGGDEAKARQWLGASNRHLAGVPKERITRIEGLVEVANYLDAVRGVL